MGLFLRQDENRTELQNRLASELKGKLNEKQKIEAKEVEPQFLEGSHKANTASMVIIVLLFILIIVFVAWTILYWGR